MDNQIMHEQLTMNEQDPIIARHYDYEHFTYPWHFHSEFEIIYVSESHGERFVADSMERFQAGDVILLGSNLPHYMRSDELYYQGLPGLRVKGVVIQFAHDYMSHAINKYAELAHIKSLLSNAARGYHFPHPRNREIIREIEALPSHEGLQRIIHLLLLLDKMAAFDDKRLLASPHPGGEIAASSDVRIEKILAFLNYHYLESTSLDALASRFSMNTTAFCRYFKQKTGKSYLHYLQDLRIGHACQLLTGTAYDVARISLECGFNTICHFNKIFKRKTALTPSEYRHKFQLRITN
jgi:AraC-like DNA-binding protein